MAFCESLFYQNVLSQSLTTSRLTYSNFTCTYVATGVSHLQMMKHPSVTKQVLNHSILSNLKNVKHVLISKNINIHGWLLVITVTKSTIFSTNLDTFIITLNENTWSALPLHAQTCACVCVYVCYVRPVWLHSWLPRDAGVTAKLKKLKHCPFNKILSFWVHHALIPIILCTYN